MTALLEIASANTGSLLRAFEQFSSVEEFLAGDIIMPFHSTTLVDDCREFCHLSYDFDGIVIELEDLAAIQIPIYYLRLPKFEVRHLKANYKVLKKHLPLRGLGSQALGNLMAIKGVTIANTDGGYFLDLTVIPSDLSCPDPRLGTASFVIEETLEVLNNLVNNFKMKLRALPSQDLARDSIQKTCLTNLARMNLLPQDQAFTLGVLQSCLLELETPLVRVICTLSKFGMKSHECMDLNILVALESIKRVSVHAGCRIVCNEAGVDMLWSRAGLHELLRFRGNTYTAMGIHEAINWQSNLDGQAMDVSVEVLQLCTPTDLTFLQLYVESPHLHVPELYMHPVSGTIVTCGLGHHQTEKSKFSRAQMYISQMEDLCLKLVCRVGCRIEQVAVFTKESGVPEKFSASQFFNQKAVLNLISTKAVLLLFKDSPGGQGLCTVSKEVVTYMAQTLKELFNRHCGSGGYTASWKAYQLELALESFFFGHPLSRSDYPLSVSLGTNSNNVNSLTYQRGFLGLAPYNSASAGLSPPPLHHWTRQPLQIARIERVFPLSDSLGSGPAVVGEALVMVLLKDLFQRNEQLPVGKMATVTPPGPLKGSVTLDNLCDDLAKRDAFPVPMTFGRARVLVHKSGQDVTEALKKGFDVLKLRYFPDVKYRDIRKRKRIFWNGSDFVEVLRPNESPSKPAVAAALTGDVCSEIERRNLSYARNLERYRAFGMPWMESILLRLTVKLGRVEQLKVLTFLSCIGMLQNGDYVSYEELKNLVAELPISQAKLQTLHIQSHFSLPRVFGLMVWKLHENIQYKMSQSVVRPQATSHQSKRSRGDSDSNEEEAEDYDAAVAVDPEERYQVEVSVSTCVPAMSKSRWSALELSLIDIDPSKTNVDAYQQYLKECRQKNISIRTWNAFETKRRRMMSDAS